MSVNFSDIYFDIESPVNSKTFPDGGLSIETANAFSNVLTKTGFSDGESVVVTVLGVMWRATRISSMKGTKIALRRIMSEPADSLEKLGYNKLYDQIILSPKLNKGGLILIAGATGAGKNNSGSIYS